MTKAMILSLCAAALAVSGCDGAPDEPADPGPQAAATPPSNLPPYSPVYPRSTITDAVVTPPSGDTPGGGMLVMATPDDRATVAAFYAKSAAAAGLAPRFREAPDERGAQTLAFNQPGTKRAFNVTLEPSDGKPGTTISLMYQAP